MEYDEYDGKHQRMLPMRCYINASLQSWEMGSANQQKRKLNLCLRVRQRHIVMINDVCGEMQVF